MLSFGTGLHAVAMLVLVIGLILGLGWVLRTYGTRLGLTKTHPQNGLQVRQRLPLSAQHTLLEITDTARRYLIVLSPQGATLINQESLPSPTITTPAPRPRKPRR